MPQQIPAKSFFEKISVDSQGIYLNLTQIVDIIPLLYSVIYRQTNQLEDYLSTLNGIPQSMEQNIQNLSRISANRFEKGQTQVKKSLRDVIIQRGYTFTLGMGYYELRKAENI